MDILEARSG